MNAAMMTNSNNDALLATTLERLLNGYLEVLDSDFHGTAWSRDEDNTIRAVRDALALAGRPVNLPHSVTLRLRNTL